MQGIPSSAQTTAGSNVEHAGFDVGQWLQVVFKYKWLVLLVAASCGALAFVWASRQAKIYEADCTVRHIPDPPQPLGGKVEVGTPFSYWSMREHFATENLVLSSRAVAERVVSELGLHRDPTFIQAPAKQNDGTPEEPHTVKDAAVLLQSRLTVQPERDTRMVHVRVRDHDPKRAALLADSIAEAYIAKSVEDRLGSTSAALEWLGKQLEGLKKQLESSELALHDFKDKNNVLSISLEDRQNIVANDIEQYSVALSEARKRRIEVAARLESLRAANAEDPFLVHASATDSADAVKSLRSAYHEAETERSELSVEYGAAHPKVRRVTNRLESLREQLRAEIDGIIQRAESELQEVTSVEGGIRGALRDSNEAGMNLNLQEIEYRRLVRERDNTDRLYTAVLERTAETDLTRALKLQYAQIVDRATVPEQAIRPRVPLAVTVGGVLGVLLGLLCAVLLSRLDRIVRTAEQAEALGLTVLGMVPQIEKGKSRAGHRRRRRGHNAAEVASRDLYVHTDPKSSVAESCRTVRTNLTFASTEKPLRRLVVTGANPREGKTTVSISLAISLAQSGKRVLLVDTDLRKPRIHRAFGLRSSSGLTSVLVGDMDVMEVVQETEVPGLFALVSGPVPPNPSELLHTSQFAATLERVSDEFDFVILDSPPLTAVTDAAVIAPQVDGVVLVVHTVRTTRDAVKSALRQLRDVNARVVGGVLNDVDLGRQKYGYGSYYYYRTEGYYATPEDERDQERPAAES